MTIQEAVKAGISTLCRAPWVGTGRMDLTLIRNKDGSWMHGPWVTVQDGSTDSGDLEPQKVLIMRMPQDDDWEPYDPMHPNGRCTCANEGTCNWCKRIEDIEDEEVDYEGCPAIGVGGMHSDSYGDEDTAHGGECAWCGSKPKGKR